MLIRHGSREPLGDVLGPFRDFQKRVASTHNTGGTLDITPVFSRLLKGTCKLYDISDDPNNYVLAQVKALHADKVNTNGDHVGTPELVQYRPVLSALT